MIPMMLLAAVSFFGQWNAVVEKTEEAAPDAIVERADIREAQPAGQEPSAEPVDVVAPSEIVSAELLDQVGLETVIDEEADFAAVGTVDLLNNGYIVVRTGGEITVADNGEMTITPIETILLYGPEIAAQDDDELFAATSLQGVLFNIQWCDENGGFITTDACDEAIPFTKWHTFADGDSSTCSASCQKGNCTTTCTAPFACIAYCNGAVPVCACVKKPKDPPNEAIEEAPPADFEPADLSR